MTSGPRGNAPRRTAPRDPAPPRWASRILEASLPPGADGESIKGDLDQEFQESRNNLLFPRMWYALESAKLAARYLVGRAVSRGSIRDASINRWQSENWQSESLKSEGLMSEPSGYPPAHRRVVHGKGGMGMSDIIQDLRYGLRQLRRNPTLSSVAAISLAVGISASTTIFAVYYGFIHAPLPYANQGDIQILPMVDLTTTDRREALPPGTYLDLRESLVAFEDMGAWRVTNVTLTGGEEPVPVRTATVTPNLLEVLGRQPDQGRGFTQAKDAQEPRGWQSSRTRCGPDSSLLVPTSSEVSSSCPANPTL